MSKPCQSVCLRIALEITSVSSNFTSQNCKNCHHVMPQLDRSLRDLSDK